jgi:hypothetical protein
MESAQEFSPLGVVQQLPRDALQRAGLDHEAKPDRQLALSTLLVQFEYCTGEQGLEEPGANLCF